MVEATWQDVSPSAAPGGHLAVLTSAPLVLLSIVMASAPSASAHPALPGCEALHQRIELTTEPAGQAPAVCLTPGRVTTFLFPTPLAPGAAELEGAGPALQVVQAEQLVTLIAGEDLVPGERRKLTVRFPDGAAPASASFALVVHPARAPYQVEVVRRERTVQSYQHELRAKEAQLQECLARTTQEPATTGQLDGLRGQFRSGLMGETGVAAERLERGLTLSPKSALDRRSTWSYRAGTRVALEVKLNLLTEGPPWEAAGATLVDARGHELALLPLWQPAPITKAQWGRVVVEAVAAPEEAQGPFTLTLWEAGGKRTFTLAGIRFPNLPAPAP
jgi:uncharacterized protein (TIGR02268 family)